MTRKFRRPRPSSALRRKLFRPVLEALEDRLLLSTFSVINAADGGAGSLRQAILDANSAAGQDRIEFNLAYGVAGHKYYLDDGIEHKVSIANIREVGPTGAATDAALPNFDPDWKHSWWSIAAPTGLPTLTGGVTIDGYTQPGASHNSQQVGSNAIHRIEVDFADWTSTAFGLAGTDNTVQGLVINRAQNNGIRVISGGGNKISGNYIGTDISGTLARGVSVGVRLGIATATTGNWIGGPTLADRNVIVAAVTFGPQRAAVYIHNSHTTAETPLNNTIQGNYIGTNAAGTVALQGGAGNGIELSDASNNLLSDNLISGTSVGIAFGGFVLNANNVIRGNLIGLDAGGSDPVPNSSYGIYESGLGTVIGGTDADDGELDGIVRARNVISGNGVHGVLSYGGSATQPTKILGNYIGTDVTGSNAVPNHTGIGAIGANIVIGGAEPGAGNLISGNTYGIAKGHGFGDGGSRRIQGNLIGTNATGTGAIPNGIGILLSGTGTTVNLIGGTSAAQRNIISGNGTGVYLVDSSAVVQGNYIGTDITGTLPLGNGNGVYVAGEFVPVERALIGGTTPGSGNLIAYNGNTGVEMDLRAQDRATILGNSIHDNGALGIELPHQDNIHFVAGPTPNDVGDADDGARSPNALQNYPVISSVSSGGGITTVAGSLNSLPGQTFRIEFFSNAVNDPSGYGEGDRYLGVTDVTTDASGNVSFAATLPVAVPVGHFVTATASRLNDHDNNAATAPLPWETSEFSLNRVVVSSNSPPVANPDAYPVNEDATLTVAAPGVLGNDTDADGNVLTALLVSGPASGALTLNTNGSFSYVPALNYFGPDRFSYKATDGSLDSNVVTVSITVNSVNDAPVANAGLDQGAFEGETVQFSGSGSSDVEGDALTYSWSFGDGGTATGLMASHPYADNGSYTVTLTVSDGSASRTDTLTVLATNVSPTATLGNSGPVNEGSAAMVSFSGAFDPSSADTAAGFRYSYDFNNNGDFTDPGEAADVTAAALPFTFGDSGTYTVHARIKDKDGGYTDYTTNVTVKNVAPAAGNDSAITDEDLSVRIHVLGNDSDPAGALDPLQVISVNNGSKGAASIDTRGTTDPADDEIVYTPNGGATGSDTFTYTISDGDGGIATGTVTVQIRNLVDVSGRVYDDKDNDGLYEPGEGDFGIGGVTVQLLNQTSGALIATRTTASDGTYVFDVNLGAGTYRVVAAQPAGFLDGRETAGNLGGAVDNNQDSNQIADILVGAAGTIVDAVDYLFAEIGRSQALGLVWQDINDDGEVNFGEKAIQGVAVELTGMNDRGQAVSRNAVTDANGVYSFADLRPSSGAGYALRELQPAGFVDGRDSLGIVNGVSVGDSSVNDTFNGVVLPQPGSLAENYNFGERSPAEGQVLGGQAATIGFWQNKNGQNLIKALNGGPTSTQLGNWLAATLPNLYGGLGGKTNAEVAEFYKTLFVRTSSTAAGGGPAKVDAQVLAVTLATYVTNQTLAGTTAAGYGFQVTENGVGTRTFNVGSNGAAFGVANNSNIAVLDLLLAVNSRSRNGLLYDLDGDGDANDGQETSFRTMANDVFSAINEAGDI